MASNHGTTYCCWIGNIPGNVEKDLIQQYLENEAKDFDSFHSINVEYNKKHNSYQCYLNFLNDNPMVRCVKYFDGKNYCGKILKASERRPKRHPSVPPPKQRLTLVQNYTETITISNSKYLKAQLENKIKLLNQTLNSANQM